MFDQKLKFMMSIKWLQYNHASHKHKISFEDNNDVIGHLGKLKPQKCAHLK